MMKKLFTKVVNLVNEEYDLASKSHGPTNNSSHESYAVLEEELDEARNECINAEIYAGRYWEAVKSNDLETQEACLKKIQLSAQLAACEFIQTAAMAHKALATIETTRSKTQQGEN